MYWILLIKLISPLQIAGTLNEPSYDGNTQFPPLYSEDVLSSSFNAEFLTLQEKRKIKDRNHQDCSHVMEEGRSASLEYETVADMRSDYLDHLTQASTINLSSHEHIFASINHDQNAGQLLEYDEPSSYEATVPDVQLSVAFKNKDEVRNSISAAQLTSSKK